MNDLTKIPTVDLIQQWESLRDRSMFLLGDCLTQNEHAIKEHNEIVPRIAAITGELDKRCEYAGISIHDGHFNYSRTFFSVYMDGERLICREKCNPRETQLMRQWLLMKEGGVK